MKHKKSIYTQTFPRIASVIAQSYRAPWIQKKKKYHILCEHFLTDKFK